jgi:hypothetical protein
MNKDTAECIVFVTMMLLVFIGICLFAKEPDLMDSIIYKVRSNND